MKFDNIQKSASRLTKIVEAWQKCGNISLIERDIALDELRHLYNEISALEICATETSVTTSVAEESIVEPPMTTPVVAESTAVASAEAPSEENSDNVVALDDDILDIDALLGLTPTDGPITNPNSESTTEVVAEPVLTPKPTTEVVAEPVLTPEPTTEVVEKPMPEPDVVAPMSAGKLFAEEDIPKGKRNERKIVSLYATSAVGATAAAAASPTASATTIATTPSETPMVSAPSALEAKPTVASVEEQPKRLVDVLGGGKRVLADKVAEEEMPTTPFNRITDLRKAIGINDKFLMIKDLFGGDAELYNSTIDCLNGFDDLDDCMIYIAENFSWNPDSAGAKLLVSLIERKLG